MNPLSEHVDYDLVLELHEAGVGPAELLALAKTFTRTEVCALIYGLNRLLDSDARPSEPTEVKAKFSGKEEAHV